MAGVEMDILSEENTMSSIPSADGDCTMESVDQNVSADASILSTTTESEKPRPSRPIQETLHTPVNPEDLIEYEWPLKSGDKYFLQEQIAELLNVTSFKRKYPDLTRRLVEVPEKEYLIKEHDMKRTIGEHQMHGLTALRAIEVQELLASENPAIHSAYQRIAAERIKSHMEQKQKELDAIKNDSKKLKELRDNAIRSASEYNSDLVAVKKAERQFYWDLQTSIIQSQTNRWKRLSAERTRVNPYPCSLIHGQFQNYYRKFTPAELRRLPLGTVLDGERLFPVARMPSPPPIVIQDSEIPSDIGSPTTPRSPIMIKGDPDAQKNGVVCSLCREGPSPALTMLKCSSCSVHVHADCIDMPDRMVEVVQNYAWNCIECKKCTQCSKGDDEEKMMFCDRCDRGYHTHCVGLKEPPKGAWMCAGFCSKAVETLSTPTPDSELKKVPEKKSHHRKTSNATPKTAKGAVKEEKKEEDPKEEKPPVSTPVSTRPVRSTRRSTRLDM